ncbi:MAG: ABC transporter permease [Mucinivorans sp.]
MKKWIHFKEILIIALSAIRSNKLRSILTMTIIAIGIMALVGIFTAIDALKASISDSFSALGANGFSIETRVRVSVNGKMMRNVNYTYTTYDQAVEFKKMYKVPSSVALAMTASGGATVKYLSTKTNPNVRVKGVDENLLANLSMNLALGRNFSAREIEAGRSVAVLGSDVAKKLFVGIDPIGKQINIGGNTYQVVGVTESQGSGMGMSQDLQVFIPITTARANFEVSNLNVSISVVPDNPLANDAARAEAEGTFRLVRGLSASDESDFVVEGNESMLAMLNENMAVVTLSATFIGLITLIGAAVGLMNIMLVSVNERTREIGTRKALGARPSSIRLQFLMESILISQMGGAVGVALGIVMGNVVSVMTGSPFVIPWLWTIGGLVICLGVGVASGYIPANRAAKLDPIEALRYE